MFQKCLQLVQFTPPGIQVGADHPVQIVGFLGGKYQAAGDPQHSLSHFPLLAQGDAAIQCQTGRQGSFQAVFLGFLEAIAVCPFCSVVSQPSQPGAWRTRGKPRPRSRGRTPPERSRPPGLGCGESTATGALGSTDRSGFDGLASQPAFQILRQRLGRRVTALGIFPQTFQTDRFEIAVHRRVIGTRAGGLPFPDLFQRLQNGGGSKGRPPCQQGIENGSQSVDVRGGGGTAPSTFARNGGSPRRRRRLFRRHVARRAHQHSRLGQFAVRRHPLGQAEVGDQGKKRGTTNHTNHTNRRRIFF